MGRAAATAGVIIVALMIAGTIPVEIDDAWLWSLLALFAIATVFSGDSRPWRRDLRRVIRSPWPAGVRQAEA